MAAKRPNDHRVSQEYGRELGATLQNGDETTIADRLRSLDQRYLEMMYARRFGSSDPRSELRNDRTAKGEEPKSAPFAPKTDWEKWGDQLAQKYSFLVDARPVSQKRDSRRELNLANMP